jgi:acetyl esterase/lipase
VLDAAETGSEVLQVFEAYRCEWLRDPLPEAGDVGSVGASDDPLVPPLTNSVRLYSLWKIAGLSAALHVYSRGGHGFGMRKQGLPVDDWIDAYADWLRSRGLLTPRD